MAKRKIKKNRIFYDVDDGTIIFVFSEDTLNYQVLTIETKTHPILPEDLRCYNKELFNWRVKKGYYKKWSLE